MEYTLYGAGDRTYVRAQQAWQILTAYVQFSQDLDQFGEGVITYGRLGRIMGLADLTAGRAAIAPVRHIFRFCEANKLPLLSAMVVRKDTGFPGWDYAVPNEKALRRIQKEVLDFPWFSIRLPSSSTFKSYPLTDDFE